MTTNHHTVIGTGAAANASVFNSPLAQLDTAITSNATSITGLSSTVTTLQNSIILGGAAVTLTNGAASAAQKVVTVDSSAQFVAGCYVEYTLVGGVVERNTVDTVDSSVQITLITNIGTGGIADNSPVAVIPVGFYNASHGVHNARDFGATGDGTTDDQPALEAAWAALADGETLVLPAGIYAVADTVAWQSANNITILAHNATIKAKTGVSFANKAVLDMAGSGYCNVVGLRIDCALASNKPAAGLVLGRAGGVPGGGANKFDNCWFTGNYTFAVVYNIGSELTSFWHCRFLTNVGGIPTYYTSSTDDATLAENTTSNVCNRFYDCTFLDYSSAATGQVLIEAQGVTKELSFRDCYMYMGGGGNVIALLGTGASMYGLVIDNVRVEGVDHADSRLLYIDQDNATIGCEIKQVIWTITSDFVIEVAGASLLRYSNLSLLYPIAATTKWMQVSNSISFNYIVIGAPESISIDSGDTATANYIVSFGDGSPFTGAGTHDTQFGQTNITLTLNDAHSEIGVARRRTEYLTVDSDTTPSVAKRDFLFMAYASPTTITDFTDAVHGQTITLITANANITIDDSGIIALKGRVNWTMPAGATLTLREFGGQWYEVGRMDPS